MKAFLLSCCAGLFFTSCQQPVIQTKLSESDSLIIQFFDRGALRKAAVTAEKPAIQKLARFIGGDTLAAPACEGFDGRLIFFLKKVETQRIEFKRKECRHFSFSVDGKKLYTNMSDEAAVFLASVEEGKSYY